MAVDDLGTVLMHEHVFVLSEELRQSIPENWDEQLRIDDAVTRLTALAETGVSTIVDPTVIGLGRDVRRVAAVNERVDLDIIVATGLYTLVDVPNYFRHHRPGTLLGGPESMTDRFVRELT
ncbi:phosphotriesterase-related protein [Streptomyces mirabilis]|uniref:Phosphotriesterase family protein n=1 Tax=Streptomyces mirabilis TaxID=68239 RepID=A0A1I2U1U2_9ACTN|nr:phosphotriesterase-related protein [Streptomyces mirabilis]SFG71100.1 Phosphotriesterase family protein [Streptomyces mirabilis]